MKKIALISLLTVAALLCASCSGGRDSEYVRMEGFAQGGSYHIICSLDGEVKADSIANEVERVILAIDKSLSGYNKGSLLSAINNGESCPLDTLFIAVFNRSKEIWEESEGAFDPSAAPLFDLWGFGFTEGGEVDSNAVDSIKKFVGMDKVRIIEVEGIPYLERDDERIKLNFNAIAQGFTCDVIARVLDRMGSGNYLVEVGREIVCKGKSSRGGLWRVGMDRPEDGNFDEGKNLQQIIDLTDKGIVTSGNYRKYYIKDGKKYAHTIDPLSGAPVQHNLLSATVIADDATTADAYATWFMVVGVEKALEIAGMRDDISVYLVAAEGDSMKVYTSGPITAEPRL